MSRLYIMIKLNVVWLLVAIAVFYPSAPKAQTIATVTPENGISGDIVDMRVTLEGTTCSGWSINSVYFELVQGSATIWLPAMYKIINDTTIDVTFNLVHSAPLGYYDLTLSYLPESLFLVKQNAFRVDPDPTPPQILSLSINSSQAGKVLTTFVTTLNTTFKYFFSFSYLTNGIDTIQCFETTYWSENLLKVKYVIPFDAQPGKWDFHVGNTDIDGDFYLENGFTITENSAVPHLLSCSPDTAIRGGTIDLTVYGENTAFDQFPEYNYHNLEVVLRKSDDPSVKSEPNEYIYTHITGAGPNLLKAEITVNFLLPVGTYDIITRDPLCDTLILPAGLTLMEAADPPALVSVTPPVIYAKDSLGNFNHFETILIEGHKSHFDNMVLLEVVSEDQTHVRIPYGHYFNDTLFDSSIEPFRLKHGWYELHFLNMYADLWLEHAFFVDNPTCGTEDKPVNMLNIAPNPSDGRFFVETSKPISCVVKLIVCDMKGCPVYSTNLLPGSSSWNIDLPPLPSGIYFLTLKSLQETITRKLIIRKMQGT